MGALAEVLLWAGIVKLAGGADSGLEGGLRGCVGYQEERGEIREAERVVPLIFYMQVTQN
jgi:hypothetical protein